jgi:holo-[acyl-carrier protein] synthase
VIKGIGVDVVDIARFERAVARTPSLADRLFTEAERTKPAASLAARFAAKEALIKAVGDSDGFTWHDMQVESDEHGNPSLVVTGSTAQVLENRGIAHVHLSLSHDGGIACAFVVAEGGA